MKYRGWVWGKIAYRGGCFKDQLDLLPLIEKKTGIDWVLLFLFLQSLSVREKITGLRLKEKSSDEGPSYKFLLLWIVRLIHADPILMLHVSWKLELFVHLLFFTQLYTSFLFDPERCLWDSIHYRLKKVWLEQSPAFRYDFLKKVDSPWPKTMLIEGFRVSQ